jgi:hypothetical protein
MPILNLKQTQYKPQKKSEILWQGWSGGWNNFYNPVEIKPNELAETINLMIVGQGTITGRWGSGCYFDAGEGRVRSLVQYKVPETNVNELLAVTDEGYLVKKSGTSATRIVGASWASGTEVSGAQLGGKTYLVSHSRELVRYSGASLQSYATASRPASVTATNISGVSGLNTWSWRITSFTDVGETLGTDSVSLVNLPQDLTKTVIKTAWVAPSNASGLIRSYGIYRGSMGNETYIATVDYLTTSYLDVGLAQSETVFPPLSDNTGGPKAGHILSLDDRLVVSDFETDPSLVMISARYPYESRFNWAYGGGYVRVAPNDGDKVRCSSFVGSNVKGGNVPSTILIFKERRTFAMILKLVTIGNYVLLDPQYQELLPVGTKSPETVVRVDNDVYFLSPEGIYSVGSQAAYLNEIRSREVSLKIRSYLQGLSDSDFAEATGTYLDHKYIVSFPTRKETIIYDIERKAFMGPWKTPFGITKWFKYYDSDNNENWLAGADDGDVKYFDPALNNDEGSPIVKKLKTRKEDFGDWTKMKILELFYILFRNVKGTVQVTVLGEDKQGKTVGLKSFEITGSSDGNAGYGVSQYGDELYGESEASINVVSDDFVRWSQLYKTIRVVQVEVTSSTNKDQWQLIATRMSAQPLGVGSLSPETRV